MVSSKVTFGAVLVGGVVGAGLLDYLLTSAGYERLGTAAWILGYGLTVLTLWYVWIRPLDLTGPVE